MADLSENKNNAATVAKEADDLSSIIRRDNEEYKIVKKLPKRFPTRPNDIYITNKTDFKAQLIKCQHILFEQKRAEHESNEIVLHAIGPAINR